MVDDRKTGSRQVDSLLSAVVGVRDPADSDEEWFAHLSVQMTLLSAAAERVSQERDDLVVAMLAEASEREVAQRLGLSPTRPGQLARRARARAT